PPASTITSAARPDTIRAGRVSSAIRERSGDGPTASYRNRDNLDHAVRTGRLAADALRRVHGEDRAAYPVGMPRYEYPCRAGGDASWHAGPLSGANAPATCPRGHDDTVKLLSAVAMTGRAGDSPAAPAGGGCCGGACGCGH